MEGPSEFGYTSFLIKILTLITCRAIPKEHRNRAIGGLGKVGVLLRHRNYS
jgi:hypothetical protein